MEHEIAGAAIGRAPSGTAAGRQKRRRGPRAKMGRKALEQGMGLLFFVCGIIAVAFVLAISVYLVISGLPAIAEIGPVNFLLGTRWYASTGDFGILAIILTSFAGTAGAVPSPAPPAP